MLTTRRRFIGGAASVAAGHLTCRAIAAERPPETTTVRLPRLHSICVPIGATEELLRTEGFTDILYIQVPAGENSSDPLAADAIDFSTNYAPVMIGSIDRGVPMRVLAGLHVGCFELFVHAILAALPTYGAKVSASRSWGLRRISSCRSLPPMSASSPARRSAGSPARRFRRSSFSSTARSTPSSAFPRIHRSCAPVTSAASSSTARTPSRGRNISAA